MRMTIHSSNGHSAEAILLVASANMLRAAVSGDDDAAVFRWLSGQWHRDTGDPVEIEFRHEDDESPFAFCGEVPTGATIAAYVLTAESAAERTTRCVPTN